MEKNKKNNKQVQKEEPNKSVLGTILKGLGIFLLFLLTLGLAKELIKDIK